MASVIERLAAKLKGRNLRLVLPEASDERVLAAARNLRDSELAQIVLLGDPTSVLAAAENAEVTLDGIEVVNPADGRDLDAYARQYSELRQRAQRQVARRLVSKPLFYGASMLKAGEAHAMVAGVATTTAKVLEACLLTIGKAEGIETPSSCFMMLLPQDGGAERVLIYADCAVNVEPTSDQLADIALASASTGQLLLDEAPRVAFLSFSSKGSANHARASKVAHAASLAAARAPEVAIDGELQADAALVERVARIKLDPVGDVAGRANVLVFPDLNAGNIAYKLTQYLAGARAIGPLLQGFARPVADLSRGASIEDIVDSAIVTLTRVKTD